MTDANSMMDKNAVKEVMSAFTSDNIVYVSGRLCIVNQEASDVSNAEASYWDSDLAAREMREEYKLLLLVMGLYMHAEQKIIMISILFNATIVQCLRCMHLKVKEQ